MDIVEVHDRILFLADKERGAFFTTEEIDNALDEAQLRQLQLYFGDDRAIQQGNVMLMYRQMQHIDDAISQFKAGLTGNVTSGSGTIDVSNAIYVTGLIFDPTDVTKRGREVPVVSKQEFIQRTESAIFKHLPCSWLQSNTLNIYAANDGVAEAQVILRPVKPDFDGPVDLNWSDEKTIDIIYLALQRLGISSADTKAVEFGAGKSNPQL